MTRYSHLIEAVRGLKKRGFDHELLLKEEKIHCPDNDKYYSADEMSIVEYHLYYMQTKPYYISIFFAVEFNEFTKGMIISSYGVYGDIKIMEFMDKVKILSPETNN